MSSHPVVLVIDDSPENLVLMSTLLKDRYKVKVANSGARGLELARSASPDIILLDGDPLEGYWNWLKTAVVVKAGKVVVDKR